MVFYDQIKKLCDTRGIKMTALARQLDLSPASPGRWRTGSVPKGDTLQRIAEYFGVSTDYLLYGDERPQNIVGSASNSAVVQGSHGNLNISSGGELQGLEAELLTLFRSLDFQGKAAVMMTASNEDQRMKAQQKEKNQ